MINQELARKKETPSYIVDLCGIVSIAGEYLHHGHSHDCFCGTNPLQEGCMPVVEDSVIEFIRSAVQEKIIKGK